MPEILIETVPAAVSREDAAHPSPPARSPLLRGAPVLSAEDVLLSRLLGRGVQFALPGSTLCWRVLPTERPATASLAHDDGHAVHAAHSAQAGDWLLLDSAAGPLYLEQGSRFLSGLTGIDGGSSAPAWPSWLVGAVAGRLEGTPLAGVSAISRCTPPADGRMRALHWRLQAPGHAIPARALAAPATWCTLLAQAGPHASACTMPWSHWLPLALDWPLLLGRHRLPLALHDALRSGDLILPDTVHFDIHGRGRISLGPRRWQVVFDGPCHLQLLNEENPLHTDPNDEDAAAPEVVEADGAGQGEAAEDDAAAPTDEPANAMLGDVSLNLRFELGRTRMSLDQLRALGPGSVLEVLEGTPHDITIACGAAEVGRGEAVDVDGRLAVRITRWGGAC